MNHTRYNHMISAIRNVPCWTISFFFAFLFCMPFQASAQQAASARTMAEVFAEMPDSLIPYLSRNSRLDMIDFLASRMEAKVTNRFDAPTTLLQLTDDYLFLQLSPSVYQQMKLLPCHCASAADSALSGKSSDTFSVIDSLQQVLCVVTSYRAAGRYALGDSITYQDLESDIRFFTPFWQPLPRLMSVELPAGQMLSARLSASTTDLDLCFRTIEATLPREIPEGKGEQLQDAISSSSPQQKVAEESVMQIKLKWNSKIYK